MATLKKYYEDIEEKLINQSQAEIKNYFTISEYIFNEYLIKRDLKGAIDFINKAPLNYEVMNKLIIYANTFNNSYVYNEEWKKSKKAETIFRESLLTTERVFNQIMKESGKEAEEEINNYRISENIFKGDENK